MSASDRLAVLGAVAASVVLQLTIVAFGSAQRPLRGADTAILRQVDQYVTPYQRMHDFSGVVLVARDGRTLLNRAYGLANYELDAPVKTTLKFGIGSITKTFTAAAIELLAERGQIALGDRVSKHLEGLAWGDSVSIEQLLGHTAGVPDYYGWPEYAIRRADPITLDEFVRLAGAKPLDFKPGTSERYSNSGYKILAAVVERVSQMPFPRFVRTQLLAPLHLSETGDLLDGGLVPELAAGYDPDFPPVSVQPAAHVATGWLAGNGSMYATAGDLAKWAAFVAADSLAHHSRLAYPYGWGLHKRFGRDVLEQNGRVPIGYTAYVGVYLRDRLTIVVLSNLQSQAVFQMGPDVAAIALGETYQTPSLRPAPPAPADSSHLQRLAGRYQVFPGFVLTVRATERGLLLAGPEGAFLPLDAEGADRFFFRPLYVPIAFQLDAQGVAQALLWAGTQACPRVN